MKSNALLFVLALASGLIGTPGMMAQTNRLEFPAPSPGGTLKQRVGLTDIQIVYSRPSARGRPIFGGLLPYGKLWRTGANGPTRISFSTGVKLNGTPIPAGEYALYTIPEKKEWTIIIHKDTKTSVFQYNETNDLVRFTAKPVKLSQPVETFTIDVNDIRDDSATLNLIWEKTRVSIRIETDLVGTLVPRIEAAMAASGGSKPYYPAALFYFEHGQDLQKAREWVNAAAANRDSYYIEYLKARILAKLGDKEGAKAAAKTSTDLAIKAGETGYVQLNKDLVSGLR